MGAGGLQAWNFGKNLPCLLWKNFRHERDILGCRANVNGLAIQPETKKPSDSRKRRPKIILPGIHFSRSVIILAVSSIKNDLTTAQAPSQTWVKMPQALQNAIESALTRYQRECASHAFFGKKKAQIIKQQHLTLQRQVFQQHWHPVCCSIGSEPTRIL